MATSVNVYVHGQPGEIVNYVFFALDGSMHGSGRAATFAEIRRRVTGTVYQVSEITFLRVEHERDLPGL